MANCNWGAIKNYTWGAVDDYTWGSLTICQKAKAIACTVLSSATVRRSIARDVTATVSATVSALRKTARTLSTAVSTASAVTRKSIRPYLQNLDHIGHRDNNSTTKKQPRTLYQV